MKPTKRITVQDRVDNKTIQALKEALVSLNANQMETLAKQILGESGVNFSRTQQSEVANNHFRLGFIAGMLTMNSLTDDVNTALLSTNPAVREIARLVAVKQEQIVDSSQRC